MEFQKPLTQLRVGDEVEGFYALFSLAERMGSNGKPFTVLSLGDRSGSIDAKYWDHCEAVTAEDIGTAIKVRGEVSEYKGNLQFIVRRIRRVLPQDPVNMADLVPTAPIDLDAAWSELQEAIESIADEDYRALCALLISRSESLFRTIPAAKSVHHAFRGGLLMHTLRMLHLADDLAANYPELINRDLLMAGTLLHDLAKTREFSFSKLGLVQEYSVEGQLLGHIVMGAQMVDAAARELETPDEKRILLEHLILSHHGDREFGAAVLPATPESEVLSFIDRLDSRLEVYRENFATLAPGTFSQRVGSLDKRIYKPSAQAAEEQKEET